MERNTLHIAFTNVPLRDQKEFIEGIEEGCYQRHREELVKHTSNFTSEGLYFPFKYYVFGNYDIVFISLIDNYDFAQKLFIPKIAGGPLDPPPFSYQIITGILSEGTSDNITMTEAVYERYPFLGICNFKLNNGFLVGNGSIFLDDTVNLIKSELANLMGETGNYIVLHSFSWFELSVLIFSSEPDLISKAVSALRSKKIKHLQHKEEIIQNSAKAVHIPPQNKLNYRALLEVSDIFSDSQSYFCIQYHFFNRAENKEAATTIRLDTEIEWQIKPGHLAAFKSAIQQKLGNVFNLSNISLITGKSDYVMDEESDRFYTNYIIQQIINNELQNYLEDEPNTEKLIDHVRSMKTKVYLREFEDEDEPQMLFKTPRNKRLTSFRKKISYDVNIEAYNTKLKKLKVSKQCRANVLKMFYHYKNGIKDPILSIYFFDFYFFIQSIMEDIDRRCTFLQSYLSEEGIASSGKYSNDQFSLERFNSVEDVEYKLAKDYEIFEQAFAIRMLNSYRYEDISDINLDFNSSIQQLLSMYNTLAHVVGSLFSSTRNHLIVTINDRSTVANLKSINYSVYDLLTPEFIFYTLPKEILNYYKYTANENYASDLETLRQQFNNVVTRAEAEYYSEYIRKLWQGGLIDFDNLVIEQIRFYFSFNVHVESFTYWTWSYAFKNSSAYTISGSLREEIFISELIRILFTLKFYNCATEELTCPLPQLETYWQKLFHKIDKELDQFFTYHRTLITTWKDKVIHHLSFFISQTDDYDFFFEPAATDAILIKRLGALVEAPSEQCVRLAKIASVVEERVQVPLDLERWQIRQGNLRFSMLRYLRYIWSQNKSTSGYINFLYRDWENGTPLLRYNDIGSQGSISYFYRIDQTGGVFFPCANRLEIYFKLRNQLLIKLWDFSMKETNEIIKRLPFLYAASS